MAVAAAAAAAPAAAADTLCIMFMVLCRLQICNGFKALHNMCSQVPVRLHQQQQILIEALIGTQLRGCTTESAQPGLTFFLAGLP
jgi:hypothetical protein